VLSGSVLRTVYWSVTACLSSWTKQGIATIPAMSIPSKNWRIFEVRGPQMMSSMTVSGRSAIAPLISKYGWLAAERERVDRKLEIVQVQRQDHVGLRTRGIFVGQRAAVPAQSRRAVAKHFFLWRMIERIHSQTTSMGSQIF
jgi:hypothetical protein